MGKTPRALPRNPTPPLRVFPSEVVARWEAWRQLKWEVMAGRVEQERWDAEGSAIAALDPELVNLVELERYQFERQRATRRS